MSIGDSKPELGARPIKGAKIKITRSVDVIYATGIIDDVSVKRYPKRVSNFLFSGFRIIGHLYLVCEKVIADSIS